MAKSTNVNDQSWDRLLKIIKQKGGKLTHLSQALGYSGSWLSQMKKRKAEITVPFIVKIAEPLKTTPVSLFISLLSDQEKKENFKAFSPEDYIKLIMKEIFEKDIKPILIEEIKNLLQKKGG